MYASLEKVFFIYMGFYLSNDNSGVCYIFIDLHHPNVLGNFGRIK